MKQFRLFFESYARDAQARRIPYAIIIECADMRDAVVIGTRMSHATTNVQFNAAEEVK